MNQQHSPKLAVIRPRRRWKHRLRSYREMLGLVPYLRSTTYPRSWVQERNSLIFARRLLAGIIAAALLIVLAAGWANACEPKADLGPVCMLDPQMRDGLGAYHPRMKRRVMSVELPAQLYDAYFEDRRSPVLFEFRVNGRLVSAVRARRGAPMEER